MLVVGVVAGGGGPCVVGVGGSGLPLGLIGSGELAPVPLLDGIAALLCLLFFFVVFGVAVDVSLVCCACVVSGRAAGNRRAAASVVTPSRLSKRTISGISLAPFTAAHR